MVKYDATALDLTFSALADPTRRRILELLVQGEFRVTDLAKSFPISLPAVSKHLRVLEKAGLLSRRREGRAHHLKLEAQPMQEASEWLQFHQKFWEGRLDALADYLENNNPAKH